MESSQLKSNSDFISYIKNVADGYKILSQESDRGAVLIGGAMLDELLAALLRSFFIEDTALTNGLFNVPNAPLATFSSRIKLVRAVGLITSEFYSDLNIIRTIRNKAAHFDKNSQIGFSFSFNETSIADRCMAIKSIPDSAKNSLPPRALFDTFIIMTTAIIAEHAKIHSVVSTNVEHGKKIELMLKCVSTIDFQYYISTLTDQLIDSQLYSNSAFKNKKEM